MRNPNANLIGMLRLIPPSKNTLAPVLEAITNSLESILERKSNQKQYINITFHFKDIDPESKQLDYVSISDSGAGFNTVSFERFCAILDNSKGYHNRGTGRLQYLHRFSQINIVSQYTENDRNYIRKFKCSNSNFIFDECLEETNDNQFLTEIILQGFNPQKKDGEYFDTITIKKIESILKSQYALRVYLEKQKNIIFPELKIQFEYSISSNIETVNLSPEHFPEPCQSGDFKVPYCYPRTNEKIKSGIEWINDPAKNPEIFKWLVFEFDAESIESHGAFICSKDIPVEHVKNAIINNANGLNGKKKIVAFYGDYLDLPENVNDSVDSFVIKYKSGVDQISYSLFFNDSYVYMDDIKKEVGSQLNYIYEELVDAKETTCKRVMQLAKELGVSTKVAEIVKNKIKLNAPDEVIIKSLHIELASIMADKSTKARLIIKQLENLNPTADNYQSQIESKSKEISLLVDEQNKEELSKYVVRREIIAKLLDKIVSNELDVQNENLPTGKRKDKEGIIHDLFFKRKTNGNINDLWVLDEEFLFYQGFSDTELRKINLPDGTPLLRSEAYEIMEKEGFKINQRPDVYLYAGEGKCILLEFKAKDVDLSDYLQQMPKYCNLLANYANIKLEKFYCYLIGENISPISSLNEYEQSVTGSWYRDSIPVRRADLTDRQVIANIRMEILKLSDISIRARVRNNSFAEKLGLKNLIQDT